MNNFTFFANYKEFLDDLPEDKRGEFALAIIEFGTGGKEPNFTDPLMKMAWKGVRYPLEISRTKSKAKQGKSSNKSEVASEENQIENKPESNQNQNEIKSKTNEMKCNEREIKEKINKKEKIGNGVSKIEINKTEFLTYLEKFNKLFSREFEYLESRWIKYKTRRHRFSQEQILRSLDTMASQPFYRGDSRRGDGWRANPDFHLRNDENILRFLEDKPSDGVRGESKTSSPRLQAILDKFQPKPHELKPTQSDKNQEQPLGDTSQGKESNHV